MGKTLVSRYTLFFHLLRVEEEDFVSAELVIVPTLFECAAWDNPLVRFVEILNLRCHPHFSMKSHNPKAQLQCLNLYQFTREHGSWYMVLIVIFFPVAPSV